MEEIIGLIVVICAPIGISILCLVAKYACKYENDSLIICISLGFILIILSLIANLVLLIILAAFYYKSDIGEYKDFLECIYVKKGYFDDNFGDIIKLRKYMIAFEIIDSIFEVLGTFVEIVEAINNYKKK